MPPLGPPNPRREPDADGGESREHRLLRSVRQLPEVVARTRGAGHAEAVGGKVLEEESMGGVVVLDHQDQGVARPCALEDAAELLRPADAS